jgi:hypothetical protein
MNIKTLLAICLLPWLANASPSPIPDLVMPKGVGVNIHFSRGHEKDLDLIAAAGFKFVRMDFGWGGIERKKGEYDWSDYDELTSNLEKRGMSAIYILDYSNDLYEEKVASKNPIFGGESKDTASPQHPESVAAFGRWAAAAALHFRGKPVVWEIWNEPNIFFWKPKPDVRQYTELAIATCKAVHQAVPEAAIIGPTSSEFPWPFLEIFLSSGVLEHLDAVSVHPYRDYKRGPETAAADYQKLRGLIEQHASTKAKTRMPIISGEWGYATHLDGVSLETQAAFIVRQQMANLFYGVPISIWYDWTNDGPDPKEREHNFGTTTSDLKPKPSYIAVQVMTRFLSGFTIDQRIPLADKGDWALVWKDSKGHQKLTVWTTGEAHNVSIDPGKAVSGKLSSRTITGEQTQTSTDAGKIVLDLKPAPLLIDLP